jgi:hypothetical protein
MKLLYQLLNRFICAIKLHRTTVITFEHSIDSEVLTEASIKKVSLENLEDSLIYDSEDTVKCFKQLLEESDWGYYGYWHGDWAHRSWVTFGPQSKIPQFYRFCPITLAHDEAFIRNCETAPKFRGKGIYPAVLSRIVKDLKKKI